jgi:hypothetical protein
MKRFLGYLIKLVGIVIVLMYTLDALYSYTFQNGLPRNKIQKILQLNNQHYDIAFLGSSRTENHIDCEMIEQLTGKSCINLGISGGTIGDMLVLMMLAESKGITFGKVLLQVDYSYNRRGMSNNFRAGLVPFSNNSVIKKQLNKYEDNYYYNNIPFYRYMKYDKVVGFREFLSVLLNKKPKTNLEIGFSPKKGNGLWVSGKLPTSFKANNDEIDALYDLLEKNDSELICFTAPFCKNIENREVMSLLKSKIPSLLYYISIFDDYPEYFFNCGHLNIEGAQQFTRIIIKDLFP